MRKRMIVTEANRAVSTAEDWLDLGRIAEVELTSEEDGYPIESALDFGDGPGWRAADPGEQLLRIVFDEPQHVGRIQLVFEELDEARTQEFVLRASTGNDEPAREIVRQQWNFHPPGATRQIEEYHTDLADVKILELAIVPGVVGGMARASLRSLRVA